MDRRMIKMDQAASLMDAIDVPGLSSAAIEAVRNDRDTLQFIASTAADTRLSYEPALLKAVHFLLVRGQRGGHPGSIRPGISMGDADGGRYEDSSARVGRLVAHLEREHSESEAVPVRAGMAHLNVVASRPFSTGNAPTARAIQALVLSHQWRLDPWLSGIDEYFHANTPRYFEILERIGTSRGGDREGIREWIRFILTGQLRQGLIWHERLNDTERLWSSIEAALEKSGLGLRVTPILYDAAQGLVIRRQNHVVSSGVSDRVASSDLKGLTELRLLKAIGEKRGRVYVAGTRLRGLREKTRSSRPPLPMPFG